MKRGCCNVNMGTFNVICSQKIQLRMLVLFHFVEYDAYISIREAGIYN